jgi:hypothetical protein
MTYPYFNKTIAYLGVGPDPTQPVPGLTSEEELIRKQLTSQILDHQKGNKTKQLYYEARQIIEHLDIAVPANLHDIGVAVGWAGTTVDAIDERINFLGWVTDDANLRGLDEVFDDNQLGVESNYGHIDALTTGCSFVSVGNNDDLLPGVTKQQQLITIESSATASVIWDYRKRRSIAGLSQTTDEQGNVMAETLYLENANVLLARNNPTDALTVVQRDQHNIGRCFMTRLVNKARPFQMEGRSEITRAVRYYTDAAVRTMLGMEVNREFYTAPQRFILNAKPEDFGVTNEMTKEEKFRRGLSVAMGMINIIPPREDNTEGDPPSVIEMKPAPPTPYIEQVKAYSIQMSAETGLPATVFGFVTDNPTSGDAIVKSEFRLTRRSSRRIGTFGQGWKETALLVQLARDGKVDPDFQRRLRCRFANPMIPTPGATSDEIQKMIAAKVLVPDSAVTYELYGRLDDRQVRQLDKDKDRYEAKQLRLAMQQQAQAAAANAQQQRANGQPQDNGQPQNSGQPQGNGRPGPNKPSPTRKPTPSSAAP